MIEVRHLVKTYGPIEAVKDVSFSIKRGEIVGFLGPNGAGKSTTMKIITGFVPATSGEVTVGGSPVSSASLEVRRRIGYLPEANPLYTDMLVYDYLGHVAAIRAVPAAERHDRIARAARLCGLEQRVGQQIGTLSKGFKQRVGLAQALIHDPEVLILDEPTSGLDPNQIVEIRNLIKSLGENRTIILSTHNLPEVMATCSRMLIIHQGTLVADGTPEELQAQEDEQHRIRLVIRGATQEEAKATLGTLEGVDQLESSLTADSDASAFIITGSGEHDLRQALFTTVVDSGWELLELHRQVLDLEGIFRKLTKEV